LHSDDFALFFALLATLRVRFATRLPMLRLRLMPAAARRAANPYVLTAAFHPASYAALAARLPLRFALLATYFPAFRVALQAFCFALFFALLFALLLGLLALLFALVGLRFGVIVFINVNVIIFDVSKV
jgi:hypothetical protein